MAADSSWRFTVNPRKGRPVGQLETEELREIGDLIADETGRRERKPTYQMQLNFSDAAYSAIQTLSRRSGRTMAEVLRDAIGLERWFLDTVESGARVLVEHDGTAREVILV
jgi:hypothetical protein